MVIHFNSYLLNTLLEFTVTQICSVCKIIDKMIVFFIPLPLLMLILGISGVIDYESPDELESINTLSLSFINHINVHSLILLGAFGLTFIIWLITRKLWVYSE